jgi:hypothetical protein
VAVSETAVGDLHREILVWRTARQATSSLSLDIFDNRVALDPRHTYCKLQYNIPTLNYSMQIQTLEISSDESQNSDCSVSTGIT